MPACAESGRAIQVGCSAIELTTLVSIPRRARGSNARRAMPGPRLSKPVPSHSASPPRSVVEGGVEPPVSRGRLVYSQAGLHSPLHLTRTESGREKSAPLWSCQCSDSQFLISRTSNKESRPGRFPDGRLPGATHHVTVGSLDRSRCGDCMTSCRDHSDTASTSRAFAQPSLHLQSAW